MQKVESSCFWMDTTHTWISKTLQTYSTLGLKIGNIMSSRNHFLQLWHMCFGAIKARYSRLHTTIPRKQAVVPDPSALYDCVLKIFFDTRKIQCMAKAWAKCGL